MIIAQTPYYIKVNIPRYSNFSYMMPSSTSLTLQDSTSLSATVSFPTLTM
jgi:hypothetical protein